MERLAFFIVGIFAIAGLIQVSEMANSEKNEKLNAAFNSGYIEATGNAIKLVHDGQFCNDSMNSNLERSCKEFRIKHPY